MRELGRMFRMLCSTKHTSWAKVVPKIELYLNFTTHCSTGFTPYELHYGKSVIEDIKKIINYPEGTESMSRERMIMLARERLTEAFAQRKLKQKNLNPIELHVGQEVLLRVPHLSNQIEGVIKKFFDLYEGPYLIKKMIGKNAFVLETDEGRELNGTYNRTSLRKYVRR